MKKINASEVKEIEFRTPWDQVASWTGYILPDARTIDAEDATDDDWEPLEEYRDWYSIIRCEDDIKLEACFVCRDDIHYACVKHDGLYSGWGYTEPLAGHGLNDLGGEPEYLVLDADGDEWYLS